MTNVWLRLVVLVAALVLVSLAYCEFSRPELRAPAEVPPALEVPAVRPGVAFAEPPVEERPENLAIVIVARAFQLLDFVEPVNRLEALGFVPLGYPAVDQAAAALDGTGFLLIAGKFAKTSYAEALAAALRAHGFAAEVLVRPNRLDLYKPALNDRPAPRAGRALSGVAGLSLALLASPEDGAPGVGSEVEDGAFVEVLGDETSAGKLWYRLRGKDQAIGFLPAGRVLVDPNVFPSPHGQRAVLGVGLGCLGERCAWDCWLLTARSGPAARRLFKTGARCLPHAFSPDDRLLAFTQQGHRLRVIATEGPLAIGLGPGTSPVFSPDGRELVFRRPGIGGWRDQVVTIPTASLGDLAPEERVKNLLDLEGPVHYSDDDTVVPPEVEFLPGGDLFTFFYRAGQADQPATRVAVRFTAAGVIRRQEGEALSSLEQALPAAPEEVP